MNYGQTWRYKGLNKVIYEIYIPLEEFTEKMNNWFHQFSSEAIEDASFSENDEFPVYDRYEEAGFPDLEQMLNSKRDLLSKIFLFNDLDILNALFKHQVVEESLYIINSLDKVEITDQVLLRGFAFKKL